jgi:hypothetical protein
MTEKISYCEKCNKTFKYHSYYLIHCETELHKTGKNKTRTDRKEDLKCNICNLYTTRQPTNMKIHILNNHSSIEEKKTEFKYYCDICNVGYFIDTLYNNHLETKKHKIKFESNKNILNIL